MLDRSNRWTPERRAHHAALIRTWRPWEKSTGPRTNTGKAIAAQNAWKGGDEVRLRELLRDVNRFLREQRARIK
jgi:hypothetical protein